MSKVAIFTSSNLNIPSFNFREKLWRSLFSELDSEDISDGILYNPYELNHNGAQIKLFNHPNFVDKAYNEQILKNFANPERQDDYMVIFFFGLKNNRFEQTIHDEFYALKTFFKNEIIKVQFYFINIDNSEPITDSDRIIIKNLCSNNINTTLKLRITDIHYIYEYKSNQFKQNLLNKISEIIRMKQEGITKFFEPHIAYYGRENTFDDRIFEGIARCDA